MNLLHQLEISLLHLMEEMECVVLPGIGAFISRNTAASVNRFSLEVKPAARSLFFNASITQDDGTLKGYYVKVLHLPYDEASRQIDQTVAEIFTQLKTHRKIVLEKLGTFHMNNEDKIFFIPSTHLNLSKSSFGLPVVNLFVQTSTKTAQFSSEIHITSSSSSLKDLNENTHASQEAKVIAVDHHSLATKKGFGKIWKIAAAIVFILMSATAVALMYPTVFNNRNQKAGFEPKSAGNVNAQEQHSVSHTSEDSLIDQKIDTPIIDASTKESIAIQKSSEISNQPIPQSTTESATSVAKSLSAEEFKNEIENKLGQWYVIGGCYLSEKLANREAAKWKTKGVNSCVLQITGSSLLRVVLGRFELESDAISFGHQLPETLGRKPSVNYLK